MLLKTPISLKPEDLNKDNVMDFLSENKKDFNMWYLINCVAMKDYEDARKDLGSLPKSYVEPALEALIQLNQVKMKFEEISKSELGALFARGDLGTFYAMVAMEIFEVMLVKSSSEYGVKLLTHAAMFELDVVSQIWRVVRE